MCVCVCALRMCVCELLCECEEVGETTKIFNIREGCFRYPFEGRNEGEGVDFMLQIQIESFFLCAARRFCLLRKFCLSRIRRKEGSKAGAYEQE